MRCRFAGVLALVAALFAIALAAPPAAAQRVALVVGNGAYTHTPALPNAANDGRAMAAALRGLGFEVIEGIDLDRRAMEDRLRAFARAVRGGEVGLFFYAGHGLQVDGRNYLLPVDARLEDESDLAFETLALDFVLDQLDRSVGTGLVFLDACRDNPLSRSLARGMSATRSAAIGRGLARIDGGIGTLIAYATEPDAVALDGDGPNSPFTTALLRHIGAPGLEVRQMLTRVRQDVIEQTRRQQVPWDHSSLTDAFYFKPAAAPATAPATAATAGGGGAELRLWDAAQSVAPPDRRIEALELYLGTYPQGRFAAMAGVQIAAARQQLAGTAERGLAVQAVAPDPAAVEAAIGLSRDQRRLAQRALTVLGFDTRGADGVFGPNSRRAIAAYQAARDAEATGYLTGTQHVALIDAAAAPLAALAAQQAEQAAARDAAAAPARPALAGGRLAAVEHWLYLLDSELDGPTVSRIAASDHDMVVVDFLPSQTDAADYPMAETVARWHEAARPKLAIAYINIGEAETYRAYWRDGWRVGAPEWILGDDPDGWENNFPVAFWFDEWRAIWTAPGGLLDQIVAAGFDGVYLDWIGAYEEDNVVAFAAADGVDPRQEMVWWIGDIAEHLRAARPGMLVIAQNALGLLDDPAYLDAIDAVAQEHVWFDGGVDNEPQGGCPLPRRNSEIGSAAWRSALTRECRRAYDSDPDGTLSASSEGYLAALERARGTGMAVFTVDYAEAAADISWIDSTARGSGFLPFIGRRALDRYQPPVD